MTDTPTWVHIGDLHLDEDDGWQSLGRLHEIVGQINEHVGDGADFVFLPGDHDFEPGSLANYEAAIPTPNRPEAEAIRGSWPAAGIEGGQLCPNKNGRGW